MAVHVTSENIDEHAPETNFSSDDFSLNEDVVYTKKGYKQDTGSTIVFTRNKVYGTINTPITGNVTIDTTNAILGVKVAIIHKDGTEPLYGTGAIVDSNSGTYSTTNYNIIEYTYIKSDLVLYNVRSFSYADISSGLVMHYGFEEGSGSVFVDQSPNSNDGTIVNASDAAWISGPIGQAIDLGNSGTGSEQSYGTIATSASTQSVTTEFTVSFWFLLDELAGEQLFFTGDLNSGTSPGIAIYALTDGRIECNINPEIDGYVAGARVRTTSDYTTTEFHHFAFTYDGTTLQAYFDGATAGSNTISGKNVGNSLTWYFNAEDDNSTAGGGTNYDDFRVYNRALTADQISELHSLGV